MFWNLDGGRGTGKNIITSDKSDTVATGAAAEDDDIGGVVGAPSDKNSFCCYMFPNLEYGLTDSDGD